MKLQWSNETFAKNLKRYMKEAGKTQKEMATIAGVSSPTFSDWINAKKMPRMGKIERLANYFGVYMSDLLEEPIEKDKQPAFEAMLLRDNDLMEVMKKYVALDEKNKNAVKQMIDNLSE